MRVSKKLLIFQRGEHLPRYTRTINAIPMKYFPALIIILATHFVFAAGITSASNPPRIPPPEDPRYDDSVKIEFLHAWNAYKQYAWGHDALRPLSREPHDWYGVSLYMTPVDAFDTMVLMGLKKEAGEAKKLIMEKLTFDLDLEVQAFEINIRLLGGLLSAYQLDGDSRFLEMAEDLGKRLLPVYNTATGMPHRYVNLRSGETRDSINNPAEIGTSLLEMGTLSKLTGDEIYYEKAKYAAVQLYKRRSRIGLVGSWINVETGDWVNKTSHIGGGIDSYYEYLVKASILFGDTECAEMWKTHKAALDRYVVDSSAGNIWYGQVDMETGERTGTRFGSLEAFFPAVLVLAGDTARAVRLQESCYSMWNLHDIEPEQIDYTSMEVTSPQYYLRPEIVESAYFLYGATGDERYRMMGKKILGDLRRFCRTDAGYAHMANVVTKEKSDSMESFFFAETLKYLYLLFAPDEVLPFGSVVFMTEAHPVRPTWND
jgi:mannosidase alpha-like ER degradation enhancer 2